MFCEGGPVSAAVVYIQHMWPQALCVPTVDCLKTYCVCSKPSLSCRSSAPGAAGSYIRVPTTATSLTCSALTHWHTFFLGHLPSICHSASALFTLVCSPSIVGYFHLAQLNTIFNALFPSVSFHYLSLLPASLSLSLCTLFICVTLAASQNSQLSLTLCVSTSLSLFFTVLSISHIYLPTTSKSLFLSLALSV